MLKQVLLALWMVCIAVGTGFAQTVSVLPSAMTQFSDGNGAPYAGGHIYMYVPQTTTPKATYQDPFGKTPNQNPITLDANGRAIIWGSGQYRQVLQDANGVVVWDQLTYTSPLASTANGAIWYGTATGTANSITLGSIAGFTGADGQQVGFIASASNTGSGTINASGYGTVLVEKNTSTGLVVLAPGDIVAAQVYYATYAKGANVFVLNNPTPAPTSKTVTLPFVNVQDYGAAGVNDSIAGSITAGTNQLSVANSAGFAVGQGVRIEGAGPANITTPPAVTGVTVQGTSGSTTYAYKFCSLGFQGSYSTCVSTSISTGPDVITANGLNYYGSTNNYVQVGITMGSNSSGYVVYRSINGGAMSLWTIGSGSVFKDQGIGWTCDGTISGAWCGPGYLPAAAPTAAGSDWFVALITAINDNALTLGPTTQIGAAYAAGTTVTNAVVWHDDTNAFNAAVAANTATGANIEVPCGTYNLSYTVQVLADYVGFNGQGMCTTVVTYGTGYDFSFPNTNVTAQQRGNFVQNMYIVDRNKTMGDVIYGTNLFNFGFSNLQVDFPPYGFEFDNSNTINILNVDVNRGTRGWGSNGFAMRSDASNYACCLNAFNFYLHGNGVYTGNTGNSIGGQDKNGFAFTGNVATIYGTYLADSDIEGNGFLIINDTGNPVAPYYLTFYSASCEFPTGRCVNIFGPGGGSSGPGDIYFTDSTFTGAQNSNPVVVTDSTSSRIVFKGGKVANGSCRGIEIASTNTTITGVLVGNNSTKTPGACDGIVLDSTANNTVISSNTIGDSYNPTVQRYPVVIVNGQDYFSVTGNTLNGNVTNCVQYSGAVANSRIIANNAGSCAAP